MQAAATPQDKPTMTLNLSDQNCPENVLRHLVIHEFGHALGLEHEHQHSDFWEVIERFIDLKRIGDNHHFGKSKNEKTVPFRRGYLEDSLKEDYYASEYDQDSIMHYW